LGTLLPVGGAPSGRTRFSILQKVSMKQKEKIEVKVSVKLFSIYSSPYRAAAAAAAAAAGDVSNECCGCYLKTAKINAAILTSVRLAL
jgi:hypothetical protein